MLSTLSLQARLAALGYPPGPLDGIRGARTEEALEDALDGLNKAGERDLYHSSGLTRIHWHWTAGAEGVIELERKHYPYLITLDGEVVEGWLSPEANGEPIRGDYSAHTLNCNSGAIGIAIDAMVGARERPLRWGSAPMTWTQIDAMCRLTAQLCRRYWIPVSRYSTLSHAEVQPTLGVRQKWKWDIAVLPEMDQVGDSIEVGDRLREMTRKHLDAERSEPAAPSYADMSAVDRLDLIRTIAAA